MLLQPRMLSYSRSPPKTPNTSSHLLVHLVLIYPNVLFQKCESIFLFSALRYHIDLSATLHCSSTTCYSDNRRRTLKIILAQGCNYTDMEHRITLRQFLQSPVFLPLPVETGKEQRQSRAEYYSILPSGIGDYIPMC